MREQPPDRAEFARACLHSRLIDAPRERVFAAFADPARLGRWWLPAGFLQVFDTVEHRDHVAAMVVSANEQYLDRLAAEVARIP